jgi:TPR repeat protein
VSSRTAPPADETPDAQVAPAVASATATPLPSPPWEREPLPAGEAALERAKRSCARGDSDDCMRVGVIYQTGRGVDASPTVARDFFSQARRRYSQRCEGHDALACLYLSHAFAEGIGVERNEATAQGLRRHAKNLCKLRPQPVCEKLD